MRCFEGIRFGMEIHRIIWIEQYGEIPKGWELHHIDGDKSNFDLLNLELLSNSDHQKIHAGWIKTDGIWSHKPCTNCRGLLPLYDFYDRTGHTPSARCKKCHCQTTAKWAKNNLEKRRLISRNWARKNYAKNREKILEYQRRRRLSRKTVTE
jgi:hypothetical protein